MQPTRRGVVVLGSLNLDYIASVQSLPVAGQTIAASRLICRFGGKGANQAVAAARQGARVSMIGCVGTDDGGRAYLKRLRSESIDVRGVVLTGNALTGTALIAVDQRAENLIIVAAGANGWLRPRDVFAFRPLISDTGALLLQFEVPMRTIQAAIRIANRAGVPVILNPSPMSQNFEWGEGRIDTLIVNAGEAQAIFGISAKTVLARPAIWRKTLLKFGIGHLIITRAAQSTICLTASDCFEVPTLPVKPVDTVGAGDAFAGAFTARRVEGLDLRSAIKVANCAGALTTLKPGAQEAIPTRAATQRAVRALG